MGKRKAKNRPDAREAKRSGIRRHAIYDALNEREGKGHSAPSEGASPAEVVAHYVQQLDYEAGTDNGLKAKTAALNVLLKTAIYIADILRQLHEVNAEVERFALDGQEKPETSPVKGAAQKPHHPDPEVIALGLEGLRRMGKRVMPHVAQLVARLHHANAGLKLATLQGLGSMGERGAQHVEVAAGQLQDSDETVRAGALYALGGVGERAAASHIAEMAALLKDSAAHVRTYAVKALGRLGDNVIFSHLQGIAALLDDENSLVRHSALLAVGKMDGRAAPYCAPIFALLEDEDDSIPHLGAAVKLLGHADADVRADVKKVLERMTEDASCHIETVAELLSREDVEVRKLGMEVMGSMAEHALPFMDAIVPQLEHEDATVRQAMVDLLLLMGERTQIAVIASKLQKGGTRLRKEAVELYRKIAQGTSPSLEELNDAWVDLIVRHIYKTPEAIPQEAADAQVMDFWGMLAGKS
eukprot:gene4484-5497_t